MSASPADSGAAVDRLKSKYELLKQKKATKANENNKTAAAEAVNIAAAAAVVVAPPVLVAPVITTTTNVKSTPSNRPAAPSKPSTAPPLSNSSTGRPIEFFPNPRQQLSDTVKRKRKTMEPSNSQPAAAEEDNSAKQVDDHESNESTQAAAATPMKSIQQKTISMAPSSMVRSAVPRPSASLNSSFSTPAIPRIPKKLSQPDSTPQSISSQSNNNSNNNNSSSISSSGSGSLVGRVSLADVSHLDHSKPRPQYKSAEISPILLISGLPSDLLQTPEYLISKFSLFGRITEWRIGGGSTNSELIITYSSLLYAEFAKQNMNQSNLFGSTIPLRVSWFQQQNQKNSNINHHQFGGLNSSAAASKYIELDRDLPQYADGLSYSCFDSLLSSISPELIPLELDCWKQNFIDRRWHNDGAGSSGNGGRGKLNEFIEENDSWTKFIGKYHMKPGKFSGPNHMQYQYGDPNDVGIRDMISYEDLASIKGINPPDYSQY